MRSNVKRALTERRHKEFSCCAATARINVNIDNVLVNFFRTVRQGLYEVREGPLQPARRFAFRNGTGVRITVKWRQLRTRSSIDLDPGQSSDSYELRLAEKFADVRFFYCESSVIAVCNQGRAYEGQTGSSAIVVGLPTILQSIRKNKRSKGLRKEHMVDAFVERWDEIRANAQAIFFTEQAVPETATDTRASGSAGSGSGGYQPFGGTAHRLTADEETTKETDEDMDAEEYVTIDLDHVLGRAYQMREGCPIFVEPDHDLKEGTCTLHIKSALTIYNAPPPALSC
eukprot:s1545_g2.t1